MTDISTLRKCILLGIFNAFAVFYLISANVVQILAAYGGDYIERDYLTTFAVSSSEHFILTTGIHTLYNFHGIITNVVTIAVFGINVLVLITAYVDWKKQRLVDRALLEAIL